MYVWTRVPGSDTTSTRKQPSLIFHREASMFRKRPVVPDSCARVVLSQEGDEMPPNLMRGTRHFPDKLRIPTSCFYTSSGVPLKESTKKRKTHLRRVHREGKHDFVVHFVKKSWSTFYLWCFHLVHILKERLNIRFTLPYCKVISTF